MKPDEARKAKFDEVTGLDAEYYGYLDDHDEELRRYEDSIEWKGN
jgi:hypothetical protein